MNYPQSTQSNRRAVTEGAGLGEDPRKHLEESRRDESVDAQARL